MLTKHIRALREWISAYAEMHPPPPDRAPPTLPPTTGTTVTVEPERPRIQTQGLRAEPA